MVLRLTHLPLQQKFVFPHHQTKKTAVWRILTPNRTNGNVKINASLTKMGYFGINIFFFIVVSVFN